MLTLNKYLREIGINENSWPFNEIIENTELYMIGEYCDERYVEGAGKDREGNEGFINAETFSMDNTLAMIIYSYLCYFREHCADFATPGCFNHKVTKDGNIIDDPNGHQKWLKTLDKMILAFRLRLEQDNTAHLYGDDFKKHYARKNRKINYGMKLFIKYYDCLWY